MLITNEGIEFSDEQKAVLEDFEEGENIYLCGSAGVGKSTLIAEIVDTNLRKDKPKNLAIVAPTGKAALNVNGVTIHSFFKFPTTMLNGKTIQSSLKDEVYEKLQALDILVIEEVSMVRIDLFFAMDYVLKQVKDNEEPFGGIQIIAIGDFNQLPPVVTYREKPYFENNKYCFYSQEWEDANFTVHHLTKSFRQNSDEDYKDNLQKLKNKDLTALDYFNENCRRRKRKGSITITPTNKVANQINNKNLAKIKAEKKVFKAKKFGPLNKQDYPIEETLTFKEGCRVVSCVNMTSTVCNGSLGTIKKIIDDKIIVDFDNSGEVTVRPHKWIIYGYNVEDNNTFSSKSIGEYTQIPLKLGYGMTIHKAQGMTIDALHVDLGTGCFEHGQLYVALSRCRKLEQLSLARSIYISDLIVDDKVKAFLEENNLT